MKYKYFFILSILFFSQSVFAQWKSYIISPRGDTLNRVDMQDKKQGAWVIHVDPLRGELGYEEEGYFQDDVRVGHWRKYTLAGDKIADENYKWGRLDGECKYYTRYGQLERIEHWKAVNPISPYDTVAVYGDDRDPTRITKFVAVKLEGTELKHGKFVTFDPSTSRAIKTETYYLNKLTESEDNLQKDIDQYYSKYKESNDAYEEKENKVAKPQVIKDFEKKRSNKKSYKVKDGSSSL